MTCEIKTIKFRARHLVTGAKGTGEVTTGMDEQLAREKITDSLLKQNIEIIEFYDFSI